MQTDEAAEIYNGEPDPLYIASVGCDSPIDEWGAENLANARLIAAAPALLEACKLAQAAKAEQYRDTFDAGWTTMPW